MNLFTNQKQIQTQKTNVWLLKGKGEGDKLDKTTRSYCVVQGTIFNIL